MFYRPAPGATLAQPAAPAPQPERPQDRAATVALVTITVIAAVLATHLLLLTYASIDRCRPGAAHVLAGSTVSLLAGHALMLVSLSVGIALCVWRVARQRSARWLALVTLGAIGCSAIIGYVVFGFEVGML